MQKSQTKKVKVKIILIECSFMPALKCEDFSELTGIQMRKARSVPQVQSKP